MIELFDFQREFKSKIRRALKNNRVVVAQAATGFGKGVVIADITLDAIQRGTVVCIACHRIEIFRQLYKNLRKYGVSPSLIEAGNYPMPGAQVYLGMVETVCKRLDKGMMERFNINFIMMDEYHVANYYKLVLAMRDKCKILGFTATPKTTGKPDMVEYTDSIVCGIPIKELIRIGRLIPTRTFSIKNDWSKVRKKGNDYDPVELAREFHKPKLFDGAVKMYLQYAQGLQALAFCVNVEESNRMMLQFRDHGIKSAHMDGKTPKRDREQIWQMYLDRLIDVVCNVGIATTGTDLPQTGCIIKNYATLSVSKDVQVGGRGGRCYQDMKEFITIDPGRNYIRHGEFGEDIDWEYIFNNPKEDTQEKSKRTKVECGECGAVIPIRQKICAYCGEIFSNEEVEERVMDGATVEEVREYRLSILPPHLRRPFRELTNDEIKQYGMHMKYSPRWAWKQLNVLGRFKK